MARLLIVSRSMALAMRLADQHEVIEHPVDDLATLGTDLDADVLVLDIGDPMQAVTTVNQLREAGQITPVLLVSGYQPEWEQVEAQQVDGVVVVPLPITRAALLTGIAELIDGAQAKLLDAAEANEYEPADDAAAPVDDAPAVSRGPAAGAEQDNTVPVATASADPAVVADLVSAPAAEEASNDVADQDVDDDSKADDTEADDTEADDTDADDTEADDTEADDSEPSDPSVQQPPAASSEQPSAAEQAAQGALTNGKQKSGRGPGTNGAGGGKAAGTTPNSRKPGPGQPGADQPGADQPGTSQPGTLQPGAGRPGTSQPGPQPGPQRVAQPAASQPDREQPSPDDAGSEPDPRVGQPAVAAGAGRAAPPWGTVAEPGTSGLPDPARLQPGAYPAPLSPPWGETVRVGSAPAETSGREQNPDGPSFQRPVIGRSDAPANRYSPEPAAPAPVRPEPQQPPGSAGPDTGSQGTMGQPSRRLPRLGNRPRKLQRRPNVNDTSGMGLVTDPLGPRTDPYGFPSPSLSPQTPMGGGSSALDRRLDSEAAAMLSDRIGPRARSSSGIVMRPSDLVQSLLDQVGDLYGVSDTAQVLADDVIERADADAAAILVPDGPIWRVSGGVGLRPLERRLILESSHWLITEIGSAGRAVLIDDTDIIRQQLAGAPLAAWRHLLAVPVPDVRAIVVLARGSEAGPFTDRDLSAVIAPVREAAALLAQAMQTRRLARALSALREADPESAPRRRD